MSSLLHSKTFWTGAAGIVGTCLLWWTGKLTANEALGAIWVAFQSIWLRDAVVKTGERVAATVAATAKTPDVVVLTPEGGR